MSLTKIDTAQPPLTQVPHGFVELLVTFGDDLTVVNAIAAVARLCKLRLDPSAQWEIRQYANALDFLRKTLRSKCI